MKKMKLLSILFISLLFLLLLAGCNNPSDNSGESQTDHIEETEITQEELYGQFELIYDNCGANATQDQEQLAVELEALKASADTSEINWPANYETLYKNWRADIIEERAATLQKEYEEIIAGRTLYQRGMDGLWETRPGLNYANCFDLNSDGKQELMLLSDCNTVEIFGDEKGHAVKFCEQPLDTFDRFDEYKDGWFNGVELEEISIVLKDNCPLIGVTASGIFSTSGHHPQVHIFYGLADKNLSVAAVVQLKDAGYAVIDASAEYVEIEPDRAFDIEIYQLEADGDIMTAEQYQNMYGETILVSYDGIQNVGLLPKDEILPIPHVEVNSEVLELDVAPYAYGGEIMAPLRDVLEAMGVTVYAKIESPEIAIFASTKRDSLRLANYPPIYGWGFVDSSLGSFDTRESETWGDLYSSYGNEYYYYLNGGQKVKVTVQSTEGKIFVPISIFSLFGNAEWDSESKTIKVSSSVAPEDQLNESDLQKIADFSFGKAQDISFENGYEVNPRGSDGSYCAEFQIAHGVSAWKFSAITCSHSTYGEMTVYNNGTCEYNQLGVIRAEDIWQ